MTHTAKMRVRKSSFGKKVAVVQAVPVVPVVVTAPSVDGRQAPRKAMLSAAWISWEGSSEQIACRVQDISATGAKLSPQLIGTEPFSAATIVPETFKLTLPSDRMEVDCKLAWRTATGIGLVFESTFRTVAKKRA